MRILFGIVALLLAAALVIQTPQVQTFVAKKLINELNEKFNGEIGIEKIHLRPFRTLILKNVLILDKKPAADALDPSYPPQDTFFRADYITAQFSLAGLLEGMQLNKVSVTNGRFNLVTEDNTWLKGGNPISNNLSRIFGLVPPEKPAENDKQIFYIKNVDLDNFRFTLRNCTSRRSPNYGGINWNNLDVRDIKLQARKLKFKGGIMNGIVEHLSFHEKSSYHVREISGKASVGKGKTYIEDFYLRDPWSELKMPVFQMTYKNSKVFKDFINKVKLDANIGHSKLNFKTISYFAPQLEGNELKASLSGKFSGYISDFDIMNMKIETSDGGFAGTINGNLAGIPDIMNTEIDARVNEFNFSSEGLGLFLSEWSKSRDIDLGRFAKGIIFTLDASANGQLNAMDIDAQINSLIGGLNAKVNLANLIDSTKAIKTRGKLQTDNLDLGAVLANKSLGPVSLKTDLEASLGKAMEARIDSLFIDRLHFNKYDYSGIKAVGSLSENMFNGTIVASDPNLNFLLQGGFALSNKTNNARYQFYANVSDADLHALNFDKRGRSKLRLRTNANFTRTRDGNVLGNISIADLIVENRDSVNHIGNINLSSHSNDNEYKMRFKSSFANAAYTGSAPITKFVSDLISSTMKKETPALFADSTYTWNGNQYNFDFVSHNSMKLMAFVLPKLYINEDTRISLNIDKEGLVDASINSKRIALGNNYLKNLSFSANNRDETLSGELQSEELHFGGFTLKNNILQLLADDNHVGASYSFEDKENQEDQGELVLNADMERKGERLNVLLDILPSSINLNSKQWNIQPSSIALLGKELRIDSLELSSSEEKISASGGISASHRDTLTLSLNSFDLAFIDEFMSSKMGLRGKASGYAKLTSTPGSKGLLADILCDSSYVYDKPFGNLSIKSIWDEEFKRFNIAVQNELEGEKNLRLEAKYAPRGNYIEGKVSLDRFRIHYAEPLLSEVFSRMDGYISGDIMAEGPLNNLELSSEDTELQEAVLQVAFTNVPYFVDGNFSIDERGVSFEDMDIRDRYDGSGKIRGGINWDGFRDISFDTRMAISNMEAVQLSEEQAQGFYGDMFASGNVSIFGPLNALNLNVDATTVKSGRLHIPMSSSAAARGSSNLLTFKEIKNNQDIDPYEALRARMSDNKKSQSSFDVKIRVNATPNIEALVEIDKTSGHLLSARGNGLIEIVAGSDLFNIFGDYTISSGQYHFSAMGLVNREFEIKDASSINFVGDILASTLNIDATYSTKTSLATLIADNSSVSNRRTVNCGIQITEQLKNPEIAFSIDIPDINPMIKSRVESALSTEDKIQKQFLSLLISNSFLPDEQSGIVNNSSMLYSNVTEAMANQISNIFHKLDIPLDLGLNYQPSEGGNDIFDVAVSTQLFNNRVVVNGNIGNKEYQSSNSQSSIVGDLDIEIKLNESGAFRMTLFSHSADQYSNYLDNSQRNGIGITYQTEFNSLGEFFRNIFSSKSQREAAKIAQQEEILSGEKHILKIDENKR